MKENKRLAITSPLRADFRINLFLRFFVKSIIDRPRNKYNRMIMIFVNRTHHELLNRVTRVETNTCARWEAADGPWKEGRGAKESRNSVKKFRVKFTFFRLSIKKFYS